MIETLPVLDDFYTQFHDNVFNYHGGIIAELLNNVRWGIHCYLEPQFMRAYRPPLPGELEYFYMHPAGLSVGFAHTCFEELMNSVRNKPYLPRFSARPFLNPRY